ncbi:hypothetical protein AGABI2DRAFT_122317 [Agaricus bisporus var. bisporus H97]|uniref:hypothetical protein n=1 Tax=Agaricus bisporus var. bisporus (strain H97 / ATCC MYA-4626 / FGSC 10389) TaxID=936046 RepID=UPI00029F76A3|nr:hypothetical protein AGABI2DRAFT_122317 [Agaricus bisporus var. bisporus H97]EKV42733.1 hypothetical protein AGABI2DRAFT_122317 [Agaricus bisporus var. bisporus H97]
MPSKRQRSSETGSRPPAAHKASKHHRSNSGSIPDGETYDQVARMLEKLIPLCNDLEKLLVGDDDTDSGMSGRFLSNKAYVMPAEFKGAIELARKSNLTAKQWLVQGSSDLYTEQLGSVAEEEDEDSGEDEEEVEEETNTLSFSHLKNIAQNLGDNVKQLKILRAASRAYHVEIIPFSSVVADDYNKLAVTHSSFGADLNGIWEALPSTSEEVTYDTLAYFATELERVRNAYFNPWSETTARKVIDAYFDSIRDPKIFPNNLHPIITSPEFGILGRSKTKEPNDYPVINKEKNSKTFLNGSTDYLTILASGGKLKEYLDKGFIQRRSKSGQKKWLEKVLQVAVEEDICLSVCEAKWSGAKLEDHIPQIVAEAIGLQSRTKRKYVPFCLSNGVEWVFGALQARGDEFSASNRFWVTKVYRVNNIQEAFKVLCVLRFWAVSYEDKVWELGCPKDWSSTPETPVQGMGDASSSETQEALAKYEFPLGVKAKPAAGTGRRAGGR